MPIKDKLLRIKKIAQMGMPMWTNTVPGWGQPSLQDQYQMQQSMYAMPQQAMPMNAQMPTMLYQPSPQDQYQTPQDMYMMPQPSLQDQYQMQRDMYSMPQQAMPMNVPSPAMLPQPVTVDNLAMQQQQNVPVTATDYLTNLLQNQ
ncbi:MAG: hypothetical protein ACP5JP_08135 [bacterium]